MAGPTPSSSGICNSASAQLGLSRKLGQWAVGQRRARAALPSAVRRACRLQVAGAGRMQLRFVCRQQAQGAGNGVSSAGSRGRERAAVAVGSSSSMALKPALPSCLATSRCSTCSTAPRYPAQTPRPHLCPAAASAPGWPVGHRLPRCTPPAAARWCAPSKPRIPACAWGVHPRHWHHGQPAQACMQLSSLLNMAAVK